MINHSSQRCFSSYPLLGVVFAFFCLFVISNAATVQYTLVIDYMTAAPDGYERLLLVANNSYPGPTLTANEGDTLSVLVINNANVTSSVHWHGMRQKGTNYMDGAPGTTQCPIPPGGSFQYTFNLDQAGTYWYHSHSGVQYTDGLKGALIIYPTNNPYTYDGESILQISDYYHTPAAQLLQFYLSNSSGGAEPTPDSGLINGIGDYNCSLAPLSTCTPSSSRNITQKHAVVNVKSGFVYRIRIINPSTYVQFNFSIDNHTFTIIELDGSTTQPFPASFIQLHAGQRVSILLNANMSTDVYWIRATIDTTTLSVPAPNLNPYILGILAYNGSTLDLPTSSQGNPPLTNDLELENIENVPAPQDPVQTVVVTISNHKDSNNILRYYLNLKQLAPQTENYPSFTLLQAANGEPINPAVNPINLTVPFNASVQLVINNVVNGPHPMHLHGTPFYILGYGSGQYNPSASYPFLLANLTNAPPKRDVVVVPGNTFYVLRFYADNPGVWLFHCHINWHLANGLGATFIENIDLVTGSVNVPAFITQQCPAVSIASSLSPALDWSRWSAIL